MRFALRVTYLAGCSFGIFFLKTPHLCHFFNQLPWGDMRLGANYEIFLPLVIKAVFFLLIIFF